MTIDEAGLKIAALESSVEALQATVEALKSDVGTLETHAETLERRAEAQHGQIEMLKAHLFGVALVITQKGLVEAAHLEGGTSAFVAHSMARAAGCHDPRPKFFENLLPPTKSAA